MNASDAPGRPAHELVNSSTRELARARSRPTHGATAALATATPPEPTSALELHAEFWRGARAHVRATAAANTYNIPMLTSLVTAYLGHRGSSSPNTRAAYARGVTVFVEWAKDAGANLVRPDRRMGDDYREHLRVKYPNPSSANTRLAAARSLASALDWVGVETVGTPFKHVVGFKDGRQVSLIRKAYEPGQVARFLAVGDAEDRAIVLLGANVAARATEMLRLTWADVTLPAKDAAGNYTDAGLIRLHGKGDRHDELPMGDELARALEALPRRADGYVLSIRSRSGLTYRMARLASRTGLITKARPKHGPRGGGTLGVHRLRHRALTDVAAAAGLAVAQHAARHKSPQTTMRYIKDGHESVAAVLRGFHRAA